jgi:hypothetical protein
MMTLAKSNREQQRDQAAYVALIVCQTEGCRVEFQDSAYPDPLAFVKLWAIPGPESTRLANDGAGLEEEITENIFDIPRQLGCSCGREDCPRAGTYTGHDEIVLFPPETGVSVNAVVRFEGRDYSAKNPDCDSLRAKYKLHCEFHHPRRTEQA